MKTDVAFIQLALKLVPQGAYSTSAFSGYWPYIIDGVNSIRLLNAISHFKSEYFSEQELSASSLLQEGLSCIPSASSVSFKKLVGALPREYANADIAIEVFGSRLMMFKVNQNAKGPIKYTVDDLALPNDDAAALIKNFDFIVQGYGVLPRIRKITLDHEGKFRVNVGFDGGQVIDRNTGKFVTAAGQHKADIISYMAMRLNQPHMKGSHHWSAIGKQNLILRTKKQYSKLKAGNGLQAWNAWYLGLNKTAMQADVVKQVLDAYEFHRIGGVLDPEIMKFMRQTLGDDWDKIDEVLKLKEGKATQIREALEAALYNRDTYFRLLLAAENDLRRQLNIKEVDVLGNLAADITEYVLSKVVEGKIAKSGDGSKRSNELAGEVVDLLDAQAGRSKSIVEKVTRTESPEELEIFPQIEKVLDSPVLDTVLLGLTVVGVVLVVVGSGGVAGGALAFLAFVGRSIKVTVDVADVSIIALNILLGELKNEKLKELVKRTQEKIIALTPLLAEALRDVQNAISAIQAEDILSLPDFKFTKEEIEKARMQNEEVLKVMAS